MGIGDKVICVSDEICDKYGLIRKASYLTKGKIYTLINSWHVLDDDGDELSYKGVQFMPLDEYRMEQLNILLDEIV